jgi:hypothetical protein
MNLPNEIIRQIIYFLHNEDIFKMYKTCKNYKQILDDNIVKRYLIHRTHPMVFNLFDNFCNICNLRIVFLCDTDSICRCNHT